MRVVSLLPSATEVLCTIGGESLLVGRSHECDWPPTVGDRPILTAQRIPANATSAEIDAQVSASLDAGEGLYSVDAELLRSLEPDVILTQDLCRVCSIDLESVRGIAASMAKPPRIVSLDPHSVFDVFDDLLTVGEAVDRKRDAELAMVALRARYWEAVDFVNPYADQPEVLFLEWADPPFGGGHWTPALIEHAGGRHSLNPPKDDHSGSAGDSKRLEPEAIIEAAPDRVVICPCGYDLERAVGELDALRATNWWSLLPANLDPPPRTDHADVTLHDARVVAIDGNQMFNRPGPRLVDAFRFLVAWIQDRPEVMPAGFPVARVS